jgi:hypothetical protein
VCWLFGFVKRTVQRMWKTESKVLLCAEQNGARIKRFHKPERSDVNEALLKLQTRDNVPVRAGTHYPHVT